MRVKMLKKFLIISAIIVLIVLIIKYFPLGNDKIELNDSKKMLEIPRLSFNLEESELYKAEFTSLKSIFSLERELNNIMQEYEKRTCNNKTIYYDKSQNITITDYGVSRGIILNSFYIQYIIGSYENYECNIVENFTDLKYQVRKVKDNNSCAIPANFKYLNENGNVYDVYYECFGDLLFQNGSGKMVYLTDMLDSNQASMKDIINFLEYRSINTSEVIKQHKKGKYILYKTKDFKLFKCDNWTNDNDIYIGGPNFNLGDEDCS